MFIYTYIYILPHCKEKKKNIEEKTFTIDLQNPYINILTKFCKGQRNIYS